MLKDLDARLEVLCFKAMCDTRKNKWSCFLCDSGSSHDGQKVTLVTDISVVDRCTVQCPDGKFERTFGRLLKETYVKGYSFQIGDVVLIIDPDTQDNCSVGEITIIGGIDSMNTVQLQHGKRYQGYSRNLIKF
jgi:hypothetical protein